QPLRQTVDGKYPFRAEQKRAPDRKLSDRAASPDRDGVTGLDVVVFGSHVAGRKDIRQEQHLIVGQSVFDFYRADVGKRHPCILGLAAGKTAAQMGIPKNPSRRMAEKLLGHPSIGIRILTQRKQFLLAEKAL